MPEIRTLVDVPYPIVALDYETYYDQHYSLSRMTTAEYLADPRFLVHGAAISVVTGNDAPTRPLWLDADQLKTFLGGVNWQATAFLAHNAKFDGAIAAWHYGVRPAMWLDSLAMARATVMPYVGSAALKNLAAYLGLPAKDTGALANMKGRVMASLTAEERLRFTAYACQDVANGVAIYRQLAPHIPFLQGVMIDEVIRWFTEPVLRLDPGVIATHLWQVKALKATALQRCGITDKKDLTSSEKFAQALRRAGVEPPTKISKTTNSITYAFARTDPGLIALAEDPDPDVQALVAARLQHKSTLEESRSERLLRIASLRIPSLPPGVLPVPLRFSGAHTHRLSGEDRINLQNLSRLDPRTGKGAELRRALVAPPGFTIVAGDLSQIEARLTAVLAEQHDLVQTFKDYDAGTGIDPYCKFGQVAYGRPVTKADWERQASKVAVLALGFGMGALRYQLTLLKDGIKLDLAEAERVVKVWRTTNNRITGQGPFRGAGLWQRAAGLLMSAAHGQRANLGPLETCLDGIMLPSGLRLRYPKLRLVDGEIVFNQVLRSGAVNAVTTWGGSIVENVVQALARELCMQALLRLIAHYPRHYAACVLQVHDELVFCVVDALVPEFRRALQCELRVVPDWLPRLPVNAEVKSGPNYGACK